MKCNTCANENYCYDGNHQLTRDGCADNGFTAYVPQTNADHIRTMTDAAIANVLYWADGQGYSRRQWIMWLKSPVDGGAKE